jgi:hypothetical protein
MLVNKLMHKIEHSAVLKKNKMLHGVSNRKPKSVH